MQRYRPTTQGKVVALEMACCPSAPAIPEQDRDAAGVTCFITMHNEWHGLAENDLFPPEAPEGWEVMKTTLARAVELKWLESVAQ